MVFVDMIIQILNNLNNLWFVILLVPSLKILLKQKFYLL